jgi:hypothetical protein
MQALRQEAHQLQEFGRNNHWLNEAAPAYFFVGNEDPY